MSVSSSDSLLARDVLARFAHAKFPLKRLVSGTKSGPHRSPWVGSSSEFAQHREYSPGDEPRKIDWKAVGKSDRYYVREYSDETNARASILLDTSASMEYRGDNSVLTNGVRTSKLRYASQVAAALAWMLIRQNDAVGFFAFDDRIRTQIPFGSVPGHLHRILESMEQLQPAGAAAVADTIHRLADMIPKRGLFILISDLLDEVPEFLRAMHHLRHCNHEVVVIQVLAHEELTFPFRHSSRFRDFEELTNEFNVDPTAVRREYLAQLQSHISDLKSACRSIEADFVQMVTNVPVEDSLESLIVRRMQRSAT